MSGQCSGIVGTRQAVSGVFCLGNRGSMATYPYTRRRIRRGGFETLLYRIFMYAIFILFVAGCNLEAADPTIIPTPDLPTVQFITPTQGDRVFENLDMPIDIVARDAMQGIARIELLLNGEVINEGEPEGDEAPFIFRVDMNWITEGLGFHVLSAIAYRPDGTPSDEEIITIEVVPRE